MGAKIGVLLNCGQQSQFSKVRREFDAGRVNLDPPMTCADWPVPGNLTLLHTQTVTPVLTYNMGTWGLTQADLDCIDTYHRRHIRQIIGVHWPNRISNVALYHRCQCRPISESIVTARWRLFGHVLRLPRDAPAQRAIDHYFADTEAAAFRGRPRTSLPTTLCSDLRRIGRTLRQPADIEALRALSREHWRHLERDISA